MNLAEALPYANTTLASYMAHHRTSLNLAAYDVTFCSVYYFCLSGLECIRCRMSHSTCNTFNHSHYSIPLYQYSSARIIQSHAFHDHICITCLA